MHSRLLHNSDEGICEQAVIIIRNLADNDPDLLFETIGLERLSDSMEYVLGSSSPDILHQVFSRSEGQLSSH